MARRVECTWACSRIAGVVVAPLLVVVDIGLAAARADIVVEVLASMAVVGTVVGAAAYMAVVPEDMGQRGGSRSNLARTFRAAFLGSVFA